MRDNFWSQSLLFPLPLELHFPLSDPLLLPFSRSLSGQRAAAPPSPRRRGRAARSDGGASPPWTPRPGPAAPPQASGPAPPGSMLTLSLPLPVSLPVSVSLPFPFPVSLPLSLPVPVSVSLPLSLPVWSGWRWRSSPESARGFLILSRRSATCWRGSGGFVGRGMRPGGPPGCVSLPASGLRPRFVGLGLKGRVPVAASAGVGSVWGGRRRAGTVRLRGAVTLLTFGPGRVALCGSSGGRSLPLLSVSSSLSLLLGSSLPLTLGGGTFPPPVG